MKFLKPFQTSVGAWLYFWFVMIRDGLFPVVCSFGEPSAFAQCFMYNPLKLSVGASEFIGCPFLYGVHRFRIYSQDKAFCRTFFLGHRIRISRLMVQRAGIQYRLGGFVGTQYDQEVAHHGGFLVVVQFHNLVFL